MLAHQGGWDEMLMVLVPIAVLAGLLAAGQAPSRPSPARTTADDRLGTRSDQGWSSWRTMSAPRMRSLPTRSS